MIERGSPIVEPGSKKVSGAMRIAITNAFLPSEQPSGVPTQVHGLANALVRNGHEVTVFSFSRPPADALYRVHQFRRPNIPTRFYPFVMAYRLATTNFDDFDVVNCHGDSYLLRTGRPVIRTFHGAALDEMKNAHTLRRRLFFLVTIPLELISARLANHVVGVSQATRVSIPAVETLIPCGVDLERFHAGPKTGHPTILFVGAEHGRKRGAWLADLFKKHVLPAVPDAELRIISDATFSETGIHRYGRVSSEQLAELYSSAWAFCLPSTYEGFGVPYIEAMAASTAVIATSQNPGAREVLLDGSYGAFVNDEQLAATLRTILTDHSLRYEMQRKGDERCLNYSWDSIAAKYEAIFREEISLSSAR
jgi:glycosyltransferase involved in cell wall biosynthesis